MPAVSRQRDIYDLAERSIQPKRCEKISFLRLPSLNKAFPHSFCLADTGVSATLFVMISWRQFHLHLNDLDDFFRFIPGRKKILDQLFFLCV